MVLLAFFDVTTPHPYTGATFDKEFCRLGATEMSTVRLAREFAKTCEVKVFQYSREEREEEAGVEYRGLLDVNDVEVDILIVLRLPEVLPVLRQRWPKARIYLWLHDLHDERLGVHLDTILDVGAEVVCVSRFHAQRVRHLLLGDRRQGCELAIHWIYLFVKEGLFSSESQVNKNQVLWASTPSKGLEEAIQVFIRVRIELPSIEFLVYNPGYRPVRLPCAIPNVKYMGRRPNSEVVEAMRESLCLFYPQTQVPETFGMVFAESLAVGTPVLAHDFGSARELLGEEMVLDCRNREAVVERLKHWHSGGRPRVEGLSETKRDHVVRQWKELLLLDL